MSEQPRPSDPPSAAEAGPTAAERAAARPARVRRAPRFGRFIGTAVVVGLLLGVLLPGADATGWVRLFTAGGLALLLGLVAAVLAVVADKRSRR
ncbi:histidine kinase [Thalassiella azotivora]